MPTSKFLFIIIDLAGCQSRGLTYVSTIRIPFASGDLCCSANCGGLCARETAAPALSAHLSTSPSSRADILSRPVQLAGHPLPSGGGGTAGPPQRSPSWPVKCHDTVPPLSGVPGGTRPLAPRGAGLAVSAPQPLIPVSAETG